MDIFGYILIKMQKILKRLIIFVLLSSLLILTLIISVIWTYSNKLPDYKYLKSYKPPVSSKVYSGNGILVSDGAMNSFLEVGNNTYGVNNWWNTPTAFSPDGQDTIVKTIQEIEIGGFGMSSGSKKTAQLLSVHQNYSRISEHLHKHSADDELSHLNDHIVPCGYPLVILLHKAYDSTHASHYETNRGVPLVQLRNCHYQQNYQ